MEDGGLLLSLVNQQACMMNALALLITEEEKLETEEAMIALNRHKFRRLKKYKNKIKG